MCSLWSKEDSCISIADRQRNGIRLFGIMDGVMKRDSLMHLPHVALAHKPPVVKLEGEMGRVNREKPFMLGIMESKAPHTESVLRWNKQNWNTWKRIARWSTQRHGRTGIAAQCDLVVKEV